MALTELEKLGALRRYLKPNPNRDAQLKSIAECAAVTFGCPIALVTMLGQDQQVFLAKTGTELENTDRKDAFCNYTILQDDILVVNDTLKDDRFRHNPLVTGPAHIRFYAGAPLITAEGSRLGSLCILNTESQELDQNQKQMLGMLRDYTTMVLEFDLSMEFLREQHDRSKQSEVKLRAFFESSATCHLFIGPNYRIKHFNRAVANFIKKKSGKLIATGEQILSYIHPDYREGFKKNFDKALHNGERISFDLELNYPDGNLWWSVSFHPIYATHGKIIGVSYNATDITHRKLYELKILAQNEAFRKIAKFQSHELRRPVASILGLVQLMQHADGQELMDYTEMLAKLAGELDDKIHLIMETVNSQQLD